MVVVDLEEEARHKPGYRSTSGSKSSEKLEKNIERAPQELVSKKEQQSVGSGRSNGTRNSSLSLLNLSCDSSTFSNTLPVDKKDKRGKFVKEEHIVKTLYKRKILSECGSRFSSNHEGFSSKGSNLGSVSGFAFPAKGNKNMSMDELIKVKLEDSEMTGIRRRVCRKIYYLLHEQLKLGNSVSRQLTLALEARINHFYPQIRDPKLYLKVIKRIFRKIKVRQR